MDGVRRSRERSIGLVWLTRGVAREKGPEKYVEKGRFM
jgi:hypothetical protein